MIALLLWLAQELAQEGAHGLEPGPRQAVAGVVAFETVSKLDFGDARNRFTAAYVFPDRARWHFEPYEPTARPQHQYFYRAGARVRAFGGGPSREFTGPERARVLLQMELRRAVMLWPDGFEWRALTPDEHRAPVRGDSCCGREPLGALVAHLVDGKPTRIEARDAAEERVEALSIHAWQEHAGRTWPRTLVLESAQGGFTETIERIETDVQLLELSFLPPDLRPQRNTPAPGPRIQPRDLVAMSYTARALPAGTSWDEARARARAWLDEATAALAPHGLAMDPMPMFELSAEGGAARCLLRLATPRDPPPEGFVTQPERAGVFALLPDLGALDRAQLASLVSTVPSGAEADVPYVRIHARAEMPIELVLPLRAAR